jgi:hypothetical protein
MGEGLHSPARSINAISPTRILHNFSFSQRAAINPPPSPPTHALDPILTDPIHSTLIYLLLELKTQLAYRIYKSAQAVHINSLCYTGWGFLRYS